MKTRTRIFIGVFLAMQLYLPLRYYLQEDADERFAWRMFISPHHKICTPEATLTSYGQEHRVDLVEILHPAWISNIKENRPEIINPYLKRLCDEPGAESVVLVNNCTPEGQPTLTSVYSRECANP